MPSKNNRNDRHYSRRRVNQQNSNRSDPSSSEREPDSDVPVQPPSPGHGVSLQPHMVDAEKVVDDGGRDGVGLSMSGTAVADLLGFDESGAAEAEASSVHTTYPSRTYPRSTTIDLTSDDTRDRPKGPSTLSARLEDQLTGDPVDPEEERHAGTGVGHTRLPVLAREPSMLESFSRTVRTYVPSSIPIPSSVPVPPRVSRPVSFGSFFHSPNAGGGNDSRTIRARQSMMSVGSPPSSEYAGGFGEEDGGGGGSAIEEPGMRYGVGGGSRAGPATGTGAADERIVWAGWDSVGGVGRVRDRRLLILAYRTGLQVWDCTDLGAVCEILNLSGEEWEGVSFASVLPEPGPDKEKEDVYAEQRPLLGVVVKGSCCLYSLRTHRVVTRLPHEDVASFAATGNVIALTTSIPPCIHILSTSTFVSLFTIPSSSLALFACSVNSNSNLHSHFVNEINNRNINYNVLSSPRQDPTILDYEDASSDPPRPVPVFTLSRRLLAFASRAPAHDSPTTTDPVEPRTRNSNATDANLSLPFGLSRDELGNAAVKVGGTVWSGMRSLGGMAYEAARAKMTGGGGEVEQTAAVPIAGRGGKSFSSKSAPSGSGVNVGDRLGSVSVPASETSFAKWEGPSAASSYITVLDLAPLSTGGKPTVVSRFLASKSQPISGLDFSEDGTSIIVTTRDGQVLKAFQIRAGLMASERPTFDVEPSSEEREAVSTPVYTRQPRLDHYSRPKLSQPSGTRADVAPWHIYDLRRGRTSAVVEGVQSAYDGRWIAIGTKKRTVHVFAVNPYGGKPDERSHMSGRVQNYTELQPLSTDVSPIVRIRPLNAHSTAAPLTFTFIDSSESTLPVSLLPLSSSTPSSPGSLSTHGSPAQHVQPVSSPPRLQRPKNYQDLLVFDPADGLLSMRRIVIDKPDPDQHFFGSVPIVGGTSMSPPNAHGRSRSRVTFPSLSRSPQKASSALSMMLERSAGLVGKESVVARWSLRRGRGWPEIKHSVMGGRLLGSRGQLGKIDRSWLSEAELLTGSRSRRILPRSVYLTHQFSFHSLCEDYHALIRRYQLDVPSTKIEVRKEVEASAYSTENGESFVQGVPNMAHVRTGSFSLDEPLASAISADLDYANPSPPVIPMLPNGTPASRPRSFQKAIPIRSMTSGLSDGMNEGFGRLRREMGRVRAHRHARSGDARLSTSAPLEFDEEDEDFVLSGRPASGDDDSVSRSTSHGDSGASVSTPSTSAQILDDDAWDGWETDDKEALEAEERFDDLVVGFMDEDDTSVHAVDTVKARNRRSGI